MGCLHILSGVWVFLHFSGKQPQWSLQKKNTDKLLVTLFFVFVTILTFLRFHLMKPVFILLKWSMKFLWSSVLLVEFHKMKIPLYFLNPILQLNYFCSRFFFFSVSVLLFCAYIYIWLPFSMFTLQILSGCCLQSFL